MFGKDIARFATFRKGVAGREAERNLSVYARFRTKNCLISKPGRFRIKNASLITVGPLDKDGRLLAGEFVV